MIKALLFVAIVAAGCCLTAAKKDDPTADSVLWKWLADNGAALNFVPGYKGTERGGYADGDIPAGGLVASIPMKLAIRFPADYSTFAELGELLAFENRRLQSPFRPYLDTLAKRLESPRHTLSWESYPVEYLHLLQDAAPLADNVITRQAALDQYWSRNGLRLLANGITKDSLRAALVTITTRWFDGPSTGPDAGQGSLIPGLDYLNYRENCPTSYQLAPCPTLDAANPEEEDLTTSEAAHKAAAAGEVCCIVTTAAPVKDGEELCVSYGHLAPDLALMQYGFLLPQEATGRAPELSRVDERGAKLQDVSTELMHSPPPPKMSAAFNTYQQIRAERDRLKTRLAALAALQPIAKATPLAPSDPEGEILQLVLQWRVQRARGLAAEVQRLEAVLSGLEAAAPAGGAPGAAAATAANPAAAASAQPAAKPAASMNAAAVEGQGDEKHGKKGKKKAEKEL